MNEALENSAILRGMSTLGPGADASAVLAWIREHLAASRQEIAAIPGADQVRAALIRAIPAVVPQEDQQGWLEEAEAAVVAYAPETLDPADQLRRHPSWVGLCALEIGEQAGTPAEEAVARAITLARRGFEALPGRVPCGDGEVLWAMAESAAEVAWWDWSDRLLAAARLAPFADEDLRAKVELLHILTRLERGEEDVEEELEALIAADPADEETLVHALWVGAQRDLAAGRIARAQQRLERALMELGEEAPEEVVERIREALAGIGA